MITVNVMRLVCHLIKCSLGRYISAANYCGDTGRPMVNNYGMRYHEYPPPPDDDKCTRWRP